MKYLLCCLCFVLSCNSKIEKQEKPKKNVYDMYKPSEMANLMNQMYDQNLIIKNEILSGNTPTEYPSFFLNIYTAKLSNFKKRNAKFEAFSKLYITTTQDVFNSASKTPVEDRFNNAIGVCISCHQTACTGPIPRIKKLLIK